MIYKVLSILAVVIIITVVIWFVKSLHNFINGNHNRNSNWVCFGKRTAKIAEVEANKGLDKLEDLVKMFDQAICDMSSKLESGMESQAKYKASIKRNEKDIFVIKDKLVEWLDKKERIREKVASGAISREDATEGALTVANTIENLELMIEKDEKILEAKNVKYTEFNKHVTDLKEKIKNAQEEGFQLKANIELAKVNKEFANIDDVDNVTDKLDKYKERIGVDVTLGDAYADLENDNKTSEDKVNELLGKESPTENKKLLDDFFGPTK